VLDRGHVKHRVWERGSGITLASGTSATAVAAASRLRGFTGDRLVDSLPGGDLVLEWDGQGPVFMTGPATRVLDLGGRLAVPGRGHAPAGGEGVEDLLGFVSECEGIMRNEPRPGSLSWVSLYVFE